MATDITTATGAVAEIDLAALCDNYRLLAAQARGSCAAVVKADAYGLGALPIATALAERAGCRHFFTATIAEAVALRPTLPEAEIGVFYGVNSAEDAQLAVEHQLIPSLNSMQQLGIWRDTARRLERALPASLHIDTGMTRLGISLAEARSIAEDSSLLDGVELQWLMSHLACASTPEHPLNAMQLEHFRQAQKYFPLIPTSFANSSGLFMGEAYHGTLARPGAALYGINPTPHLPNPMKPVVSIHAPIIQLRTLDDAQQVGYGATYDAPKGARLAAVACGYADGLIRALGNRAVACIDGQRAPIAGIVSMDVTILDISALPEGSVQVGAKAEFVGEHLPVDDVAAQADTIGYELFTSIGRRVRRVYHWGVKSG